MFMWVLHNPESSDDEEVPTEIMRLDTLWIQLDAVAGADAVTG